MKTSQIVLLAGLIALTVACGYSSKSTPPQPGAMPAISQLAPNNTNAGGPDLILTVNGTNFNSNAAVNWNGKAQTTSYVSSKQLTATIPAADTATSGTAAVTVTNPGTSGGLYGGGTQAETSASVTFTIN